VAEVEFVGPFDLYEVVIDGYRVPHLTANVLNGGRVLVAVDHRFDLDLTLAEAERVLPFVAHCIAVAHGYAAHPGPEWGGPTRLSLFTPMHSVFGEEG
jgi:hypothetical protein